jgi:hypothetical protein
MEKDLDVIYRLSTEGYVDYINRLCNLKRRGELQVYTWSELATLINEELGLSYSESTYRKNEFFPEDEETLRKRSHNVVDTPLLQYDPDDVAFHGYNPGNTIDEEVDDTLTKMEKLKMKISDERIQARADLRRISREETIKEIAKDYAEQMAASAPLVDFYDPMFAWEVDEESEKEAILGISDWHYGIEIDNYWNVYNREIALERIGTLYNKVCYKLYKERIKKLHIVNLGDLICGRIHLTLRLQSRIDVVTQIMDVSEILAKFIHDIVQNCGCKVEYYDCLDNHSRIEPKKTDSLELESLSRIIPWYLKDRLKNMIDCDLVNINSNTYGEEIVTFNSMGHNVACVHGHNDSPGKIVDSLAMMVKDRPDLILAAHYHHFSGDEKNEIVVVGSGSLMGTDTYAKNLRLTSKPSQNLIIVSKDNPIDAVHRILV